MRAILNKDLLVKFISKVEESQTGGTLELQAEGKSLKAGDAVINSAFHIGRETFKVQRESLLNLKRAATLNENELVLIVEFEKINKEHYGINLIVEM